MTFKREAWKMMQGRTETLSFPLLFLHRVFSPRLLLFSFVLFFVLSHRNLCHPFVLVSPPFSSRINSTHAHSFRLSPHFPHSFHLSRFISHHLYFPFVHTGSFYGTFPFPFFLCLRFRHTFSCREMFPCFPRFTVHSFLLPLLYICPLIYYVFFFPPSPFRSSTFLLLFTSCLLPTFHLLYSYSSTLSPPLSFFSNPLLHRFRILSCHPSSSTPTLSYPPTEALSPQPSLLCRAPPSS